MWSECNHIRKKYLSSTPISLVIRLAMYTQEADPLPIRDPISQHLYFLVDAALYLAFIKRLIGPKEYVVSLLAPVNIVVVVMEVFASGYHAHPAAADCFRHQRLQRTNIIYSDVFLD